jgi:hypothetical protein
VRLDTRAPMRRELACGSFTVPPFVFRRHGELEGAGEEKPVVSVFPRMGESRLYGRPSLRRGATPCGLASPRPFLGARPAPLKSAVFPADNAP